MGGVAENEWKFYADEVREYAALVVSALILTHRCLGDGASVTKRRVRQRRRKRRRRGRVSLTGGRFLHLLPLPLLLLSLENIQRNT